MKEKTFEEFLEFNKVELEEGYLKLIYDSAILKMKETGRSFDDFYLSEARGILTDIGFRNKEFISEMTATLIKFFCDIDC